MRRLIPAMLWPLFFAGGTGGDAGAAGGSGEGGGAGAGSGGTGGSTSSGDGGDKGKTTSGSGGDSEPMIPKSRFDEVNREYQRMKAAEERRIADDLKAKGEHEKLAEQERAGREKAQSAMKSLARRTAFVEAAAGRVSNVQTAVKLALVDGMLDELEVDDDGQITKGDASKIVEKMLADEQYAFLKPDAQRSRKTGEATSGAGGNPIDMSKLTSEQKINLGLQQGIAQLPAHRQGEFGRSGG